MGDEGNVYRMQTLVFIKPFKGFLPTKTKCFFPIIKLGLKLEDLFYICNHLTAHGDKAKHKSAFLLYKL